MQYPGYNSGKIALSEGDWFPFLVYNYIQLQDREYYFILQDINGLKHFLPAEFYKNYGFKIEDEVLCRIDRINCTGRIFLEPKHPNYNEGEKYFFEVYRLVENDSNKYVIVKDISGNCIEVPVYGNKIIDLIERKEVECIVKNIKKGELILEFIPPDL